MFSVFERCDIEVQFTPSKSNIVADYLFHAQTFPFQELNLENLQNMLTVQVFQNQKCPNKNKRL